jgi:hypothetical protein
MRSLRVVIVLLVVLLVPLIPAYFCLASTSGSFYYEGNDIFDNWRVSRTRAGGEYGYLGEVYTSLWWPPERIRPVIVFESLGEWSDIAYRLGQQFADDYPDHYQRAEQVFYFVRDKVRYTSDSDQFGVSEFALNADELANTIVEEGRSFGDCEDMAILLAVMYKGAGFRSAIVDCKEHVGMMVHLPDYHKANVVFELAGESGWIWAEATGSTNPFGWFPQGQLEGDLLAYEISAEPIAYWESPDGELPPQPMPIGSNPDVTSMESLFSVVVGLVFIVGLAMTIALLIRRHRA